MNEVRIMRLQHHPAILPLYAAFLVDDQLWMVLPFVAGGSAQDILRRCNNGQARPCCNCGSALSATVRSNAPVTDMTAPVTLNAFNGCHPACLSSLPVELQRLASAYSRRESFWRMHYACYASIWILALFGAGAAVESPSSGGVVWPPADMTVPLACRVLRST